MSATLTEPAGTGIAPPHRPSFWKVGWATFLGYLSTVLIGIPLAVGLAGAGIDLNGNEASGRGVFVRYDVWSWLAEGCLGLLATFVTAALVGWQLRERTGWEVPFSFAFFTLLLTGYAPLLTLTPLYGAAAPVSLAAAALILRWRCEPCGAEPHRLLGGVPRRYRRGVAVALMVAGPLMFAYVLAYGATHPLQAMGWGTSRTQAHQPGKLDRYNLSLENAGPLAIRDVSIVRLVGSPVFQLERMGIEARTWTVPDGADPRYPPMRTLTSFEPGQEIALELRQGRLCPPGIARLDAVWVRYTVLGTRQEQRLSLEDAPRVRCP